VFETWTLAQAPPPLGGALDIRDGHPAAHATGTESSGVSTPRHRDIPMTHDSSQNLSMCARWFHNCLGHPAWPHRTNSTDWGSFAPAPSPAPTGWSLNCRLSITFGRTEQQG